MKAPRLSSSLVTRILAVVVASVMLTALGSFIFSNLAARSAFGSYVTRFASVRRQHLVALLEEYYRTRGSWAGVEVLLDAASRMGGRGLGMGRGPGFGMRMGEFERVMLLDPSGSVISDTAGTPPGTVVKFQAWEVTPVRSGSTIVGLLLLGVPEEREASVALYTEFIRSVTAGTLYSVLGAAALALVLSYYIAERTVKPVRELTAAVAEVARGNLTTRVKAEGNDEIARLAQAFNTMSSALEVAEKKRKDLVADVAHELRTPLTVLKSNFEGIKDGVIESTPELMETLSGEVERLSRLVSDLHVLALADSGKLDLHMGIVDCERLLTHAREAFGATAATKSIEIKVVAEPGLKVNGDWTRLLQVVTNLLENAVRHTPAGGQITLSATRLTGQAGVPRVALTVEDTGEGIPERDLPHVFDRFYRGDRSRSRKTGGSGLGLAIAADLIKAHGGTIGVESEPGMGTRFTIVLDAA